MSGFCGLVAFEPGATLAPELTAPLCAALRRRAVGGVGLVELAGALVAQDLDRETPLEGEAAAPRGDSPGLPAVGSLRLVGDLRLDDPAALAAALELGPAPDRTDADLVLAAYARWGTACFARMRGDFALAILDPARFRLVLARDPLGVRPVYYAPAAGHLVFASSVPTLLACPLVPRDLDPVRLAEYLALSFDDRERTFYAAVRRLAPGHFLVAEGGALTVEAYYRLTLPAELHFDDRRDYDARFRELLVAATLRRLRSPHDAAFLLSGGLDSSSLVGIARSLGPTPPERALATFSGTFPDYPEIDERGYIDEVLAQGGFAAHFRRIDRESPLRYLDDELARHGQPFYSPNVYVDTVLLDDAAAAGVRLLLDGLDGDTTVGHGWEHMGQLLREGRWRRLLGQARALAAHTDRSALWFLYRHAIHPTFWGLIDTLVGRRRVRAPALVTPAFARSVDLVARLRAERERRLAGPLATYREQHFAKLASGLLPMSFEIATVQASSRGIVRRHPYFDQDLVEFCLALPPEQRLDRGADRLIQRRAVGGFTPELIRRRLTKSIWAENFRDRIAAEDRRALETLLPGLGPALADFIDIGVLSKKLQKTLTRTASQRDLAEVWMANALGRWLKAR